MKFEPDPKIDELLNAFIDGELPAEERAEVQRLVAENGLIAKRLREIERCRLLVSSLPPAEPPAEVVSGIKQLVQAKWSQGVRVDYAESSRGARHLFTRQVLAASIVAGLAGLLVVVIYGIVGPESRTTMPVAVQPKPENRIPNTAPAVAYVEHKTQNAEGVEVYSLKLATNDFAGVDAFINKLLDDSTWLRYEAAKERPAESVYRVFCSRGGLEELMTDLSPVWSKFDTATFVVYTEEAGKSVAVEQVRPEQVTDIAKQNTMDGRIRLAKDFAALNSVERLMPAEKMLAFEDKSFPELMTIPKPALTSGERSSSVAPKDAADKVRVDLSIVVTSRK